MPVKFAPLIAGNAPVKFAAVKLVIFEPLIAAAVPVKFAAGTPVIPEPLPENDVAVKAPVLELNERLLPVFGAMLPVAAVANTGKQVVSDDSSATVIVVEVVAVPVNVPVKFELPPVA